MQRPKKLAGFDLRIDYALILPVLLLSLIGFIALYLSLHADYPAAAAVLLWQQAAWLLVGLAAAFFVMHFDSRTLWNLSPFLYGLGLALMLLPIFVHTEATYLATGARNWIGFGTTNLFQPSELMKVAYILFMARIIVAYRAKSKKRYLMNDVELIIRMTLATIPVFFLLIGPHMQNDLGTALVFFAIFSGMLLVSGVSWRILLPLIAILVLVGGGVLLLAVSPDGQQALAHLGLRSYQSARFQAWLHPFADPHGTTYQQAQALLATASGGVFGTGAAVTNISVPVRESDMIFTVIGGGAGFLGAALVIFLYLYLIYRMMRATFQANSQFYTFIAAGLTMMILFHVFENIGATIGILPLTGIPLPFISQGGSNLISNMIGVGLILSIRYSKLPPITKSAVRIKYRKQLIKRIERTKREGA